MLITAKLRDGRTITRDDIIIVAEHPPLEPGGQLRLWTTTDATSTPEIIRGVSHYTAVNIFR